MVQKEVRAIFMGEKISFKQSQDVAKMIRRKNLSKAKDFLDEVLLGRKSIDGKIVRGKTARGKTFPRTTHAFLTLLKSAEANAKQKNMDTEKLFVKTVKADHGFKYIRPKSAAKYRGRRAKITNISVILEEK